MVFAVALESERASQVLVPRQLITDGSAFEQLACGVPKVRRTPSEDPSDRTFGTISRGQSILLCETRCPAAGYGDRSFNGLHILQDRPT